MALNYTKTNTFVTGTTIASSAVNANFDDVVNAFGGIENLSKSLSNMLVDTILRSAGTIQAADGTVSLPGLTWTSDLSTGLYRIGTSNIGIATAGVKRMDISDTLITTTLPLTVGGALILSGAMTAGGAIAMGTNKITGIGNGTAATDAVAYQQLHILQAPVFVTTNTSTTTTSATYVDVTNMSGTITPTSASSKIFVILSGTAIVASGGNTLQGTILRGSTDIFGAGTPGFQFNSVSGSTRATVSVHYTDSPASTSALTYKAQIKVDNSGQSITFGNGQAIMMTLVEVG